MQTVLFYTQWKLLALLEVVVVLLGCCVIYFYYIMLGIYFTWIKSQYHASDIFLYWPMQHYGCMHFSLVLKNVAILEIGF